MRSGFGCDACGSPAVRLPLDLHEDAPIQCDGCGCTLMAWGAFKRRVEAEMSREAGERSTAAVRPAERAADTPFRP
ncbi:hypothetical protein [Methylobacterium isbiliense]|uniref:Transcription factor zinc-finger domain-containing protein n=1 Tax=Methylobacterium isbiliense TaxID=315478 RepID=A0ABQ4SEB7_9HYPH|nr:hypothetical protein [Methylobacterium isbiliense]MDN3623330.1 hypothetical protein [Methylobacterium isbiliense]GJE00114.1 hypothetical protein GMJLKIPL_2032 [Methylobacterium isbiliense]